MSALQREQALRKEGATAERRRLDARFHTLQDAVEKQKTQLLSQSKAHRAAASRSAAHIAGLKDIITREREAATALGVKSDEDDIKLSHWMHWAWVGQNNALKHGSNVDAAASAVREEHLRAACNYWEARALDGRPPPSMAVAAKDASIRYNCTHMSLTELFLAMSPDIDADEVAPSLATQSP